MGFSLHAHNIELSQEAVIKLSAATGDYFTCIWDFGDHSQRLNMTYNKFLDTKGVVIHKFEDVGGYKVTVSCANRLYSSEVSTQVGVYVPVSKFKVTVFNRCDGEGKRGGVGIGRDVFKQLCDVVFDITAQKGSNVTYTFDFGYDNENGSVTAVQYDENSNIGTTVHRFDDVSETYKRDGLLSLKVNIKATNGLNSKTIARILKFVSHVSNFTVVPDRANFTTGQTFSILLKISKLVHQTCYLLEYGPKGGRLIYPRYVVGDESCKRNPAFVYDRYKEIELKEDRFVILHSFYFNDAGYYMFRVTAKGLVNTLTETIMLNVLDHPCYPPKLSWESAMALAGRLAPQRAPLFKCRKNDVLGKALKDCSKQDTSIKMNWYLRRVFNLEGSPVDDNPVDTNGMYN